MSKSRKGFIAVHVGAGKHSEKLKDQYQKICKEACKIGIQTLNSKGTVLDAAVDAAVSLENSPLTNAGYGSNLNLDGKVECDASVMDSSTLLYGAVGAVSGIKNPVLAARHICLQQLVQREFGRIPPSFLVGDGAFSYAQKAGIETVCPESLISEKAFNVYKHYKRKVEDCKTFKVAKRRMDTIGAICVDEVGNIASVCSSGGIILKYPGRIGQAGVWGCGVWASKENNFCVGASTSGCGEHLVRTTLARTMAEAISSTSCPIINLHQAMKDNFIDSRFLSGLDQKLGGVIAIKYSIEDGQGDFLWSHSTNSMIIGYMNSDDKYATSHMSVHSTEAVGKSPVVNGVCFKLNKLNKNKKT